MENKKVKCHRYLYSTHSTYRSVVAGAIWGIVIVGFRTLSSSWNQSTAHQNVPISINCVDSILQIWTSADESKSELKINNHWKSCRRLSWCNSIFLWTSIVWFLKMWSSAHWLCIIPISQNSHEVTISRSSNDRLQKLQISDWIS